MEKLDQIGLPLLRFCHLVTMQDWSILVFSIFNSMVKDYGVEAKPDHFAGMLDLLGRVGKLNEAADVINKMPFKPHPTMDGT